MKVLGIWNGNKDIEIVEIEGRAIALYGWNGECYTECFEVIDGYEVGKRNISVYPVYDEAATDEQWDIVDYSFDSMTIKEREDGEAYFRSLQPNGFKNLLSNTDMNLVEFCNYFDFSYRTAQAWKAGERKCPKYLLKLMKYKLEKEGIFKNIKKTYQNGLTVSAVKLNEGYEVAVLRKNGEFITDEIVYKMDSCIGVDRVTDEISVREMEAIFNYVKQLPAEE